MGLGISNESIRHQQIIAKGEGYHTRYEHDECIIVVMFYVLHYSLIASGIKMDWDSKKNCRAAPYTIHATFIRIVHAWNEGLLHGHVLLVQPMYEEYTREARKEERGL